MKITILNISEHGTGLCSIIFNSEHHQPSQSIVYPLTSEQVQELTPGTVTELHIGFPVIKPGEQAAKAKGKK